MFFFQKQPTDEEKIPFISSLCIYQKSQPKESLKSIRLTTFIEDEVNFKKIWKLKFQDNKNNRLRRHCISIIVPYH